MTLTDFGNNKFYISRAVQKAFVEVDEAGTTAAAATGPYVGSIGRPRPPRCFVCDWPFAFTITYRKIETRFGLGQPSPHSQTRRRYKVLLAAVPIFSGKVVNPSLV